MRILFMAAEAAPFAKVGGLGDVAGSLPAALALRGHEVMLLLPGHPITARHTTAATAIIPSFHVDFDWAPRAVGLRTMALAPGLTLALLDSPDYFNRQRVYGEPDDVQRYVFFSKLGLEAVRRAGWQPDVVHAHDWQTAPAIDWLAVVGSTLPFWSNTRSVFTIHNLAYQGLADLGTIGLLGVEAGGRLPIEAARQPSSINFMARGITRAHAVTTVSPTYALEIQQAELGEGLHTLLARPEHQPTGILNGIDLADWDPAGDRRLAAPFDADHLARRGANRRQLQAMFDLAESPAPLIGIVSRLTGQKGFDLIADAMPALLRLDVRFAVLGAGEPFYERFWMEQAAAAPLQVGLRLGFDAPIARLVYGGSDLFLMPSRFEPCGIGQLLAMRYGSVPIVRATGGLNDTVLDSGEHPETGTGFVFRPYQPVALIATVERALKAFRRPAHFRTIVRRAMALRQDWDCAALAYESVYQRVSRAS